MLCLSCFARSTRFALSLLSSVSLYFPPESIPELSTPDKYFSWIMTAAGGFTSGDLSTLENHSIYVSIDQGISDQHILTTRGRGGMISVQIHYFGLVRLRAIFLVHNEKMLLMLVVNGKERSIHRKLLTR